MLNALMSDIHGNRQAFEACIQHAEARNVGRYIFLGDYVGYGADPEWVVRKVRSYVDEGALAVVGNHDRAISDPFDFNEQKCGTGDRMDQNRTQQ